MKAERQYPIVHLPKVRLLACRQYPIVHCGVLGTAGIVATGNETPTAAAAKVRGVADEALLERQAVDEALRERGEVEAEGGEQERAKHRRIEVNANFRNPKDSPKPADDGRPVHTALGLAINAQGDRHVNNPGASARDKDEASVIAVGNGRNFENGGRPGYGNAGRQGYGNGGRPRSSQGLIVLGTD